jgi:hypothetical protein
MSAWRLFLLLAVAGCATWQAPTDSSDAAPRSRAVSASSQGTRVSAALLSPEESRRMFGVDIDHSVMQPVWVEVENGTSRAMWFLRAGTDQEYFSPLEVAWSVHSPFAGRANASIDEHFEKLGFRNPIAAGATRAGIVFTHPERGTKLLNVDLFGPNTLVPFTLFLPVPKAGATAGSTTAETSFRFPASQVVDYRDLDSLRAAIERLPGRARTRRAEQGDPLNVVLVGEFEDIGSAMVRRNYHRDARAADMTQEVYGRGPDVVLRKQAPPRAPAAWIRAWRAPVTFEGRAVYLAQAGRPVGGRFAATDASEILTHEDVDETRNLLVQDMMYSGGLDKLGFVQSERATKRGDGLRAVLFFATRPLSLDDVEILEWVPFLER